MATPCPDSNSTTTPGNNNSNIAGPTIQHHHPQTHNLTTVSSSMQETNTCWRCQNETGFQISLSGVPQSKRKALKLNFANPPVKPASRLPLNPPAPSFQNPHIERLRTHSIESSGKLKISPEQHCDFTAEDLRDLGEIGRGAYGSVNKMVHKPTGQIMAVKRIRSTVDEKEQKQLLMDLDVVMRSSDCPYIVQFYGALFREGDCWICMELMSTSFDKFYKYVYCALDDVIPEEILGKITLATVKALNHLKENLKIIHRDIKPSNILMDRKGNIKLCDFGISGQLVDSIAKTRDAGCRPYMAPYKGRIKKAKIQGAPETLIHPDVRRTVCGRRQLRLSHPGSDPHISHLPDVRGLMKSTPGGGGGRNTSHANTQWVGHLSFATYMTHDIWALRCRAT
ncbi:dual specificity mitogen-activated protein kinase kinase 4b isoform X4 [Lampris incognitus]|uniref:dual specificity mitogen-activated protein kinase kinase 4b isoform X4 n=1 Tax=Lampris incognitus TaxID=2546036 RepID=UPI0024B4CBFF|nr:dual specificity mitogen-activated protein kinase kinase 4b isoform X4 [Lampris incognitus]